MTKHYLIEVMNQPHNNLFKIDDVKKQLNIDHHYQDDLITECLMSAILHISKQISYKICGQKYKITYQNYLPNQITLPIFPVTTIEEVSYNFNGQTYIVPSKDYQLTCNQYLTFPYTRFAQEIKIRVLAGYTEAQDVPFDIKRAIILQASDFYLGNDNYENNINRLITPYKRVKV